ncbi:hypothetical protein O181_129054 [Austropuccinia psidii MF-1]|uniref:Uncharacterized protein n=1 Tax=Austropuccinia psidii MF-1 TaxID=1389203 RepID=A0A9Q3Q8R0_9BASI|nr:hypothetical protein [Austropuccinia psidii MF-1]
MASASGRAGFQTPQVDHNLWKKVLFVSCRIHSRAKPTSYRNCRFEGVSACYTPCRFSKQATAAAIHSKEHPFN